VITDRELDIRLAGAAGVHDAALPPLPEDFLAFVVADRGEPASVVAARQLVTDAHDARRSTHRGFRRRRKLVVRAGAAVLAVAAAWTTAVLVVPSDGTGRPAAPTATDAGPSGSTGASTAPNGIALVSAEEVTFPLSLDPAPEGLTPLFSLWGGVPYYGDGPLVYAADYMSADGDRVLVSLFPDDPRTLADQGVEGVASGTVALAGHSAEVFQGEFSASLLWERPDGRWVRITGEGAYGDVAAVVPIAESVVDRPQPLGLQFGLAPAGWSLGGYEESRSIDLVNDAAPEQPPLRVSVYGGPGFPATIDSYFEGRALVRPLETATVQGSAARLGLTDDGADGSSWMLAGQLPGGPLFLLLAPPDLTREQVLEIGEQVTYTQ
jgi:hypothetical protein